MPPPPMSQASPTEFYSPKPPQQIGRLPLYLPGSREQQVVAFQVIDGMAVYEGDIMLGPVSSLPMRYGLPKVGNRNVKGAIAVSDDSYLWPGGDIPYVIGSNVSAKKREYIQWAVGHVNQTEVNLRPRTSGDGDYVTFDEGGHGCTSYVGRIGGSQKIQVAGCGRGSIVHEILHAAGFYHEQSRSDRDDFVTIHFDEIVPSQRGNFEKRGARAQDIGPYDYGSIMHYSRSAFSKSGRPTIVPKDSNAQIGQRDGLSPLDRQGITYLYGGNTAPPTPPPTTEPPGTKPPGAVPSGTFAGRYTSNRGDVTCAQNALTVTCQYPGGSMICAAQGTTLDCGWTGGGQGRARFTRQANGTLAGTYGDFLSNNSRGQWNLVPAGGSPGPGTTTPPGPGTTPPPGPSTGQPTPPPAGQASLAGSYTSTRGPMACQESGATVTCTFQEGSAPGRLSCSKSADGLRMACNWATFFPMPAFGQASFTRQSPQDRNFSGSWGRFNSANDGGKWDMQPQ